MKKYIKPSMEVTEVMLESPILVASTFGKQEIEGTDAQSREMRNFSLWDGAEE